MDVKGATNFNHYRWICNIAVIEIKRNWHEKTNFLDPLQTDIHFGSVIAEFNCTIIPQGYVAPVLELFLRMPIFQVLDLLSCSVEAELKRCEWFCQKPLPTCKLHYNCNADVMSLCLNLTLTWGRCTGRFQLMKIKRGKCFDICVISFNRGCASGWPLPILRMG